MTRLIIEQDESTGEYRFKRLPEVELPLVEDKCPPVVDENGNAYYPEPSNEEDPEIMETEKYAIMDKEEYYNYVTGCNACGTTFIAYTDDTELVRNYCPGCGKKLI